MIEKRKATESSKKSSIIKYKEKFKELKIVTLDDDDNAKKWKSMKENIKNGSKLDRARWMCNLCGKEDYNKFTMKRHIKTHSQGHKHKCQVCSYCFKNIESLNFHWFIFHANGKNNWKEEEDESEPSETNIDDVPWTKRKKGYTCDICGHYSDAISKIVRHTNTHTNTHSKKCGFCSFNFMNSKSLTNHISLLHSNQETKEYIFTSKVSNEIKERKNKTKTEDPKSNVIKLAKDNEKMSPAEEEEIEDTTVAEYKEKENEKIKRLPDEELLTFLERNRKAINNDSKSNANKPTKNNEKMSPPEDVEVSLQIENTIIAVNQEKESLNIDEDVTLLSEESVRSNENVLQEDSRADLCITKSDKLICEIEITNEENRRNAIVETAENPEPVEEIVECTENKQVENESSEKMAETEELNKILKVTVSLQIESEKINKGPEQVITSDQSFTRTNENTLVSVSGEIPELDEEIVECSENIEDENDISEEITQSEDNEKVLEDTVSVSLHTEPENTNKRREEALTADQNYKSSDASEDPSSLPLERALCFSDDDLEGDEEVEERYNDNDDDDDEEEEEDERYELFSGKVRYYIWCNNTLYLV